jgi:hypothetical protein
MIPIMGNLACVTYNIPNLLTIRAKIRLQMDITADLN